MKTRDVGIVATVLVAACNAQGGGTSNSTVGGNTWAGRGALTIYHDSGEEERCTLPGMIVGGSTAGSTRSYTIVAVGANCTIVGVVQNNGSVLLSGGQRCVVTSRRGLATATTNAVTVSASSESPDGLVVSGTYARQDGLDRGSWQMSLTTF